METDNRLQNGTNLNECKSVTYSFLESESGCPEFKKHSLRSFSRIIDEKKGIQIIFVHDIYHLPIYKRRRDKNGNWDKWVFVCDFIQIVESGIKIEDEDVIEAVKSLLKIL